MKHMVILFFLVAVILSCTPPETVGSQAPVQTTTLPQQEIQSLDKKDSEPESKPSDIVAVAQPATGEPTTRSQMKKNQSAESPPSDPITLITDSPEQKNETALTEEPTCTDSDGGKTYTERGVVKWRGREFKDYCHDKYLTEYICKDGQRASVGVLCFECVEGHCTKVMKDKSNI